MKLYLVQHADAVSKDQDPARPLSEKGRTDTERMASFLARSGVKAGRVIHSGKPRALETALLLARVIGPGNVVEQAEDGLAPNDPTDRLADAIAGWPRGEDVIVVGHLPFMNRMVSRLTAGSDDSCVVSFEPGCVVCLDETDNGWSVAWMAPPSLLGG